MNRGERSIPNTLRSRASVSKRIYRRDTDDHWYFSNPSLRIQFWPKAFSRRVGIATVHATSTNRWVKYLCRCRNITSNWARTWVTRPIQFTLRWAIDSWLFPFFQREKCGYGSTFISLSLSLSLYNRIYPATVHTSTSVWLAQEKKEFSNTGTSFVWPIQLTNYSCSEVCKTAATHCQTKSPKSITLADFSAQVLVVLYFSCTIIARVRRLLWNK